ncbi:MAG: alpha/beta hydrolase [Planctomycetes bacterium]|nr:alpha/beta hydrolase [Planctomycetota bacterium]
MSTVPGGTDVPRQRTWTRRLRRVVLLLGSLYLGVFLVLLALERWLIFHPTTYPADWIDPPPALHAEDVWLSLEDGARIHAWWCPAEGWRPSKGAILYAHGNAGNLSYRAEPVRMWQEHTGMGVLIFDYPGYGRSSGKPNEAGCYAAADAGYDWLLREQHIAPESVVLYGGSLGGAVMIELATRRPYRALVVVSAFTSIPDMAAQLYPWLPTRRFIRNRFESLDKIGRTQGRVFLAHGTADRFIPYSMGERLFAAAPEPKAFLPLVGHDHNDGAGPEFYAEVVRFLARTGATPARGEAQPAERR